MESQQEDSNVVAVKRQEAWQRMLLPLMGAVLVGAAIFFAVMSVWELRDFYSRVEQKRTNLDAAFAAYEEKASPNSLGDVGYLRFKVVAVLEADALHRRYHQATATMLARIWTRQLGFLTGMLLAIVGAAFILGRLREDPTRIEGEGGGVKGTLETSSPGLVLSTLGAALMAITLIVPFSVETHDVAIYLKPVAGIPPPGGLGPLITDDPGPPPGTLGSPPGDLGIPPESPATAPRDSGPQPTSGG